MAIGLSLVLITLASPVVPLPTPPAGVARAAERCSYDSPVSQARTADDLLANIYHLGQHPAVTLPHDLTWREDPLGDRQWRQKLQMLRYVVALMYQWQATDDTAYRDRGIELMRSWIAANPYGSAASPSAWKDQVTAWRAMTFVCVAGLLPQKDWLDAAIADARRGARGPGISTWAAATTRSTSPSGCSTWAATWGERTGSSWRRGRMGRFIAQTIDDQGVSDEQAVKYDRYDYDRMMVARAHLVACGVAVPASFSRVARIPTFLAQATRPDGHLETIGDSDDIDIQAHQGDADRVHRDLRREGHQAGPDGQPVRPGVCVRAHRLGRRQSCIPQRDPVLAALRGWPPPSRTRRCRRADLLGQRCTAARRPRIR